MRFLHQSLRWSKKVKQVVQEIPRALDWWMKRVPRHSIDRPLLYLQVLLSDAGPAVIREVVQRLQLSTAQSRSVEWAGTRTNQAARVLRETRQMRPSRVYRLLSGMPDEAIVLLVAKGFAMGSSHAARRLTSRLSQFLKRGRRVMISTTGEDLKKLGLKPGPQFKKILEGLLESRLDGVVTTKSQEVALARRLIERLP